MDGLLHHPHTRYDKLFPYLWAFVALLAAAGLCMDSPARILAGLWTIVVTEDALITDYVLIAGPGAALVNSALVTGISLCVLYLSRDIVNGMTLVVVGLMSGFSLFGKNYLNIWPILIGTWLYTRWRKEPFGPYANIGPGPGGELHRAGQRLGHPRGRDAGRTGHRLCDAPPGGLYLPGAERHEPL